MSKKHLVTKSYSLKTFKLITIHFRIVYDERIIIEEGPRSSFVDLLSSIPYHAAARSHSWYHRLLDLHDRLAVRSRALAALTVGSASAFSNRPGRRGPE